MTTEDPDQQISIGGSHALLSMFAALSKAAEDTDFVVGLSNRSTILISNIGDDTAGRVLLVQIVETDVIGPNKRASTTEFLSGDDEDSLTLIHKVEHELFPLVEGGNFVPIPNDASELEQP